MKMPRQKKFLFMKVVKMILFNFDNDIVLLRWEHKVSISTNITPICSLGKDDRFQMKVNDGAAVSGRGRTLPAAVKRPLGLQNCHLPEEGITLFLKVYFVF